MFDRLISLKNLNIYHVVYGKGNGKFEINNLLSQQKPNKKYRKSEKERIIFVSIQFKNKYYDLN